MSLKSPLIITPLFTSPTLTQIRGRYKKEGDVGTTGRGKRSGEEEREDHGLVKNNKALHGHVERPW